MNWIIPKKQEQEIASRNELQSMDFNAPLPENDGGVCVAVPRVASAGKHEADDDIKSDRVKQFNDLDCMVESLKKPW